MSELASLEKSLLDLLSKLDSTTCPIILGGGYGLYLRRTILEHEGTRFDSAYQAVWLLDEVA